MTEPTAPAAFPRISAEERETRTIAREAEADRTHLATYASARGSLRSSLKWGDADATLSPKMQRHYALRAIAALNVEEEDDGLGGKRLVGPYVEHAVRFALKGVDYTSADFEIVHRWAAVYNVAGRISF